VRCLFDMTIPGLENPIYKYDKRKDPEDKVRTIFQKVLYIWIWYMKNNVTIIKQKENAVKNTGSIIIIMLQCGPSIYFGLPFASLHNGFINP